ncbi:MAG: 3'-5' exonuclease [Myxococcales bacterium]|nr:3'-5' exonuclease [Myxococcales bacterium]MCB9569306.1 3'-5' exonuclease [Myxococcales bacterium]MCB9705903.1 3'-5' exonuclease [Myxococcales bacterium]
MTSTRRNLPSIEELGPRFAAFARRLERPLIFFDTETTGTEPATDRIVEISLVRLMPEPGGLEEARTWRIDPGVRIPIEATEIHGITNADVEGMPVFAEVADDLLALFRGADLAGFNVGRFDIRVLQAELVRVGKSLDLSQTRVIDAQVIFHQKEPRNLAAALRFYCDRELEGAHGAEADTVATLEVFAGQLDRYSDLDLDVGALHAVSNAINNGYVDLGRRFAWRDNEPVFNFGKHKGKPLRWAASDPVERGYLRSLLSSHVDEDAKLLIREALEGRIRSRKPLAD